MKDIYPVSMFYKGYAGATFAKASMLEISPVYDLDGACFVTISDYALANLNGGQSESEVIFNIMSYAFKIGYLKGGRAALRGKFKEPKKPKACKMIW